jgi:hypothetical protein
LIFSSFRCHALSCCSIEGISSMAKENVRAGLTNIRGRGAGTLEVASLCIEFRVSV